MRMIKTRRGRRGAISRLRSGIWVWGLDLLRCECPSFCLVVVDGGRFANVGCSVSFVLTGLLVWRDDRANKVGGGASHA